MSSDNLRKRALVNGPESANGATSQGSDMKKTDSVVNLTKSELYSLYDEDPFSNLSNEDMDFKPSKNKEAEEKVKEHVAKKHFSLPIFLLKLLLLTGASFLYNQFTTQIHQIHTVDGREQTEPLRFVTSFLTKFSDNLRPLKNVEWKSSHPKLIIGLDLFFVHAMQGISMGILFPIMDRILPLKLSERLLSSAPQSTRKENKRANFTNDLIRSMITFLGISYAMRKIEWASAIQLSMIWSLLNPCLWLLLDGTISGFLSSGIAALAATSVILIQNLKIVNILSIHNPNEFLAIALYITSYFFCGLIIFGKLGRAFFG